ncbi:MAG: hypothetical protein ACR2PR_08810 [Pseudohongiellaceae bacterium]
MKAANDNQPIDLDTEAKIREAEVKRILAQLASQMAEDNIRR